MSRASLSGVKADRLPKDNDEKKEEYKALLAVFIRFMESISEDMEQWEVLEELMALRADFLVRHAFRGFDMSYENALELLRNWDGLTAEEEARRNIVLAAMDNLVDFAVAEEYQMAMELPDLEDDDVDEEDLEEIFEKYNERYAEVENNDAEYAMIVAAGLLNVADTTVLTYMTQGDERVRPWHLQYEGYSAPKMFFPAWLMPPIEHQCRCYLVEDSMSGSIREVKNATIRIPQMPAWFNRTFKESVALGGRIFSDEHPYFQIDERFDERLHEISERIKQKYLNG